MAEVRFDGSRAAGSGSLSEAVLWAALDVSPDGFAVHQVHRDDEGRAVRFTLESINRAGAAPHAAGPTDVVGRDLADLLPDAEGTGIPQVFRAGADTGVVQNLRTAFDSPDWSGTMDLLVARVDDNRIVVTWRDVTEQVRSEQILVDAYTRAQAAWDCLYGVLDAVQDAVLLLRVNPAAPDDTARPLVVGEPGGPGDAPARIVVEYLNAAAAGAQDRSCLMGMALGDVNPQLGLDDHLDHVVDLVVAAASDGPARCASSSSATGSRWRPTAPLLHPPQQPAALLLKGPPRRSMSSTSPPQTSAGCPGSGWCWSCGARPDRPRAMTTSRGGASPDRPGQSSDTPSRDGRKGARGGCPLTPHDVPARA